MSLHFVVKEFIMKSFIETTEAAQFIQKIRLLSFYVFTIIQPNRHITIAKVSLKTG